MVVIALVDVGLQVSSDLRTSKSEDTCKHTSMGAITTTAITTMMEELVVVVSVVATVVLSVVVAMVVGDSGSVSVGGGSDNDSTHRCVPAGIYRFIYE